MAKKWEQMTKNQKLDMLRAEVAKVVNIVGKLMHRLDARQDAGIAGAIYEVERYFSFFGCVPSRLTRHHAGSSRWRRLQWRCQSATS
jgi:hypothetical protein